jgi:hypothetical protein
VTRGRAGAAGPAGLIAVIVAVVASCGGEASSYVTTWVDLDDQRQLASAGSTAEVGGVAITLDPYLWRDFMPPTPAERSDLRASVTVMTATGRDIPPGLDVVRLYLVNGADAWVTDCSQEGRPSAASEIQCVARGGPRWDPGLEVDVYVKVADAAGTTAYLAARGRMITATY